MQRHFVGHQQIADRALGTFRQLQQFLHGGKGIRHLDFGAPGRTDEVLFGIDHETAADRIQLALGQQLALLIPQTEAHAVGVQRDLIDKVEEQILRRIERHRVLAHERDALLRVDGLHTPGDAVGIDIIRNFATQAHQHGTIGAVAHAGVRQRAKQLDLDPCRLLQRAFRQLQQKTARRAHRADGVRAAGPDTDLEHVLQADVHGAVLRLDGNACPPRLRPRSTV